MPNRLRVRVRVRVRVRIRVKLDRHSGRSTRSGPYPCGLGLRWPEGPSVRTPSHHQSDL